METKVTECPSCQRHLRVSESECPFCGQKLKSLPERILNGVAASVTMVVLAACYGPPSDKLDTVDSGVDLDQDGFFSFDDCDDNNSAVNPAAVEVCDDTLDNDCDGAADLDDTDCQT